MTVLSLSTKQKYGTLLGPNSAFIPGHYESIATVSVNGSGASSIDFTSIPTTYQHLQVRGMVRQSGAGTGLANLVYRFNNDPLTNGDTSSSNYVGQYFYGNGTSQGAGISNRNYCSDHVNGGATTSAFAMFVMDIYDYQDTNKYRFFRCLSGCDLSGGGEVTMWSGFWKNTNALNQLTFYPDNGNFVQYSHVSLYGIKVVA